MKLITLTHLQLLVSKIQIAREEDKISEGIDLLLSLMRPVKEAAVVENKVLFMFWLFHKPASHSTKVVLNKMEHGPTGDLSSSLYIFL